MRLGGAIFPGKCAEAIKSVRPVKNYLLIFDAKGVKVWNGTSLALVLFKVYRARPFGKEIYSRVVVGTWVGRPTLNFYEEAVFYVPTFFEAIRPHFEALREPTSLINAGFQGDTRFSNALQKT